MTINESEGPVRALMFLRVDSKIESMLKDEVLALQGVKDAHYIYGPYDMYVDIETESFRQLNDLVISKIRGLYGIISTTTCYIAETTGSTDTRESRSQHVSPLPSRLSQLQRR
jgi:DNA-binding Lrp family transcriptional regulator